MKNEVLLQSNLRGIKMPKHGKVRDIYELEDKLLIIATDRISAFDVILPNGIPQKGSVLTQLSKFWFDKFKNIVRNHLISTDISDLPDRLKKEGEKMAGRFMLVRKAEPLPVECVVRGYLSGSGWSDYKETGTVCGIKLPPGLKESDRLKEPIFTPATKADLGAHDENIGFNSVKKNVGEKTAEKIKELSMKIYSEAREYAENRGIIIADTKFEFGIVDGEIILIDEALTPDSSRFWPMDEYKPGGAQKSFDKQFVRDYLISINFNRKPPAPELPPDIVQKTMEKYLEAYRRLTGSNLL
ncbi:MAG TPA: phosphoribosylaminoimidazolesuccinocarboxamide synthase [bacterium]